MPKAVSATEAKNRFGSLVGWVTDEDDEVIVERQGRPRAVIMSIAEYEKVQELREQRRREEALATLRRLRAQIQARNQDLTVEEADAIADRATRDAIQGLIDKGTLRFEDPSE